MRAANLLIKRSGVEAPAQRKGDGVLRQDVQAAARWRPRLDGAARDGLTRCGVFDQFQRLRRDADHVAGLTRPMLGAAGALQQPRDAFGAADLQYLIHRGKIHAQIQAGRRDHTAQAAIPQALLSLRPKLGVQRTVMQRQRGWRFGPDGFQRAMP
ncbi:hypothetical protein G6F57_018725 [Rhizopus arrhizus]|nr:hypothetical protein G6F57_018725 [Rhizopus arrhizus]